MSTGNLTNLLKVGVPATLPDPWPDELVYGCVEDGTEHPAVATLRYRDPGALMLEKTGITIGRTLTVAVRAGDRNGETRLFTGEVVTVESEFDGTGTYTIIRAMDLSHRMRRGRRVVSYRNQTAADIARRLATEAGLPLGRLDPTTVVYEMVSQPNVSDWEFLRMLAADNDVELAMVDGKFEFRRPVHAAAAPGPQASAERDDFVAEVDGNVLSMRATVTSVGQVTDVEVRGWDRRTCQPVVGRTPVRDSPEVQLPGVTAGELAAGFGKSTMLVADVPYETQAEVDTVSRALAAQVAVGFAELEVAVRGNPRLRAGVPFALTGVGRPFAGKYTVTASRHVFGPARFYETWLTVSGGQDRSLTGLAAGAPAPARSARMPGLAIGVVTNVKAGLDREHPERLDRAWVKLRFPWLDLDYETDWVRTVQVGSGQGGGVVCPEAGDEVLVGFEQGLLDRPYVIGGLYNGVAKPSEHDGPLVDPTSGSVNRLSFASRQRRTGRGSTGNWVELLDGPTTSATQGVRLRTEKGAEKLLLHLDRAGTSVLVRSDGSVVIEAKTEVTVQGADGVSVESRGPVSVTGRGVSVDAGLGELNLTGASVAISGKVVRIN
ncbi:VgrG-related protein [Micromonospora sp. DT48]|uniref:VgrG-related protein n=1 Tax=unclassified Micromonospora TaxID=2617518 RepID=UPI0012BCB228|nr:VgrG-related protein [Micromonospora sp. CP22]MTK03504.1 VgrG-related protein [Micromonospora sp. CP22]